MVSHAKEPNKASTLEFLNKELVKTQARKINKELTRLKCVSEAPLNTAPLDVDGTGKFITVPINQMQSSTIEAAYQAAEKTYTDSELELPKPKKKRKWFNWS